MGAQWKEVLDAITASVSNINMKLTHEQKEIFNFHFARVFGRASAIHGNQMKKRRNPYCHQYLPHHKHYRPAALSGIPAAGGERSGEPQENIVRTLLNCPGLTPSAHIPQKT